MTSVTGAYSAGAIVPFTETFISGTITTAIPLVGQVLNNGQTNFVGYGNGSAEYILPSSAAGAVQTTLADGKTYYVSSGAAPSNVRTLGTGAATVTTSTSVTSSSRSTTGTGQSTTTSAPAGAAAGDGSSTTSSSTSSTSTHPGAAQRVTVGGVAGLMLGVLAVFGM